MTAFPDRGIIEAQQLEKLRALLEELLPANRFYTRKLDEAGVGKDLASLAEFTSKASRMTISEAAVICMNSGLVSLCYPFFTLESILPRLGQQTYVRQIRADHDLTAGRPIRALGGSDRELLFAQTF